MTATIKLTNVSKHFQPLAGHLVQALKYVSLTIEGGEFLTVVGSSGSGKSTLLQLVAGIDQPSAGAIEIVGDAQKPRIGFVFQANTVFPWRTVEDNLAYALELRGLSRSERNHAASEICKMIRLDPSVFLKKYPKELSGGETRRVAIGMALAYEANILLFDEPTSQLDYWTKLHMQEIVQSLWLERAFTAVYVTHDIDESIFLGDRVLVVDRGEVAGQVPINLARPRNKNVLATAEFSSYRDKILNLAENINRKDQL